MRMETCMSHLPLLMRCTLSKVVEKSIAFRGRTDITRVRDWTGDFARGLWVRPGDFSYPGSTDVQASKRLEKVQSLRHRNGLGAPTHAQFAINAADLGLNRVGGNDQSFCHLGIGAPSHQ